MASVADIRKALDEFEIAQSRGAELKQRIADLDAELDRLRDELRAITPAIASAESAFKSKVQALELVRA